MRLENIIGIKGILVKELDYNNNEIARGTLYVLKNKNPRPFGFIEDVYVAQESRRGGYGRKVMEKLLKIAKEENCYKVVLGVREKNSHALSLYESLGFRRHDLGLRLNLE
ncbi:MAG: GNAT family N-acetyltransferase [Candidatus Woesearchaeota archaeon]